MISCLRFNVAIFFYLFEIFFFLNNFLLFRIYEVAFENNFVSVLYANINHKTKKKYYENSYHPFCWEEPFIYDIIISNEYIIFVCTKRKMWSFMYLLKNLFTNSIIMEQFHCFYSIRKVMGIAFRNSNIYIKTQNCEMNNMLRAMFQRRLSNKYK